MQSKLCFFAWEATWRKILTLDKLQKRGLTLANRCIFQESEETADHILLHCRTTRGLWELLFSLFGVSLVLPSSVRDTLLSWRCSFATKERRRAWKVGPLCIFWVIWKTRNNIIFRNEELSLQKIKFSFDHLLWSESKSVLEGGSTTLADFIVWMGSCSCSCFVSFLFLFLGGDFSFCTPLVSFSAPFLNIFISLTYEIIIILEIKNLYIFPNNLTYICFVLFKILGGYKWPESQETDFIYGEYFLLSIPLTYLRKILEYIFSLLFSICYISQVHPQSEHQSMHNF